MVAIDTKGENLIVEAEASKLFEIEGVDTSKRLVLKLISEGEFEISSGTLRKRGRTGFTVWASRNGRLQSIYCSTDDEAVRVSLRT